MATETTFSYIDDYCERLSFNAEPVNVITNLAFIVSGFLLLKLLRNKGVLAARNFDLIILALLVITIGIGSATYHFMPNSQTLNFDVIPIAIYIHILLLSILFRVFKLGVIKAILLFIAFVAVGVYAETNLDKNILNGTISYIPTYVTLIFIVLGLKIQKNPLFGMSCGILILWTFSLIFRTFDAHSDICHISSGIGTHFMWHILNAVVLYRLVLLVIRNMNVKS